MRGGHFGMTRREKFSKKWNILNCAFVVMKDMLVFQILCGTGIGKFLLESTSSASLILYRWISANAQMFTNEISIAGSAQSHYYTSTVYEMRPLLLFLEPCVEISSRRALAANSLEESNNRTT